MPLNRQDAERIARIFMFPKVTKTIKDFVGPNEEMPGRLAHYTTAANALEIIKTKCIWLRNARAMRDYAELEHGYRSLVPYLSSDNPKPAVVKALETVNAALVKDVLNIIRVSYGAIYQLTHISCFTEHDVQIENNDGRLSMWLTVPDDATGAAIIFRAPKPYAVEPLNTVLRPVVYGSSMQDIASEFDEVSRNVELDRQFLQSLNQQDLANQIAAHIHTLAVTMKSMPFKEEKEWRICHFPYSNGSKYVPRETTSIRDIPQVIFKLPLVNMPEAGINGIGLTDVIDRVIVGPSQHQNLIIQSFIVELENAGVKNAGEKVAGSSLTLR